MSVFMLGFAYGLCVALAIVGIWTVYNEPSPSGDQGKDTAR